MKEQDVEKVVKILRGISSLKKIQISEHISKKKKLKKLNAQKNSNVPAVTL